MRKAIVLFLVFAIIPFLGQSQTLDHLDYVSPFHNGYAAIKKDGQWAFINSNGDIAINFRTDLVVTKFNDKSYPVFNEDRCIIKQIKNGISYFGFVDTNGKTVIKPQFLNATNFNNGKAIALELIKENVAKNKALEKNIVYYKYFEVVIDINGDIKEYINPSGVNMVLDKDYLKQPPKITSRLLTKNLVAKKNKKGKWILIKLK